MLEDEELYSYTGLVDLRIMDFIFRLLLKLARGFVGIFEFNAMQLAATKFCLVDWLGIPISANIHLFH